MSKLSILVVSCDRYADVWLPFFTLFWKYWPDCPYSVYLGANTKTYNDSRVKMVLTSKDHSWSESTRRMVEQMSDEYILILLEDFLYLNPVNSSQIEECYQAIQKLDGGYLRLKPFPKPDLQVCDYSMIGEIKTGAPYRAALQASIWRKDILLELLRDGETAWNMELNGSRRSDRIPERFFCVWKPVMNYRAGITLGKWTHFAVKICKKEGVSIDTSLRSVMTWNEDFRRCQRVFIGKCLNKISWKHRRVLGDFLRKLKLIPPKQL